MPEITNKLPKNIKFLSDCLKEQATQPSFDKAKATINAVISLLSFPLDSNWQLFSDTQGKIRSNAAWFMIAEGFADKRAAYKVSENNGKSIDLKVFWVKNFSKTVISWLVALTPNFEDEPFYKNLNIGIDFVIPERADRVFVVLSDNYIVRTLELYGQLSVTQQEILFKWMQGFDFTNKAQVHETLWQSFDLKPVNKEFYQGIVSFFAELKDHLTSKKVFSLHDASLFTNRLIGRVLFCWFLDKKEFLDRDQKYFETDGKNSKEHYELKLEKLFFRTLNTKISERKKDSFALIGGLDTKTPFLNGGLFTPRDSDCFGGKNLLFPADYFHRLYEFLKRFNFTTDESTSYFQQVAIDPEMLGRIFENLLAEQLEETGEQARKAKGAFYTPREIVDYMCRESLREYLKNKIPDDEYRDQRISQLIDTKPHEFRDQQRNYRRDLQPYKYEILKTLDSIKIVDPACGSGAFPMGMLHLLLDMYERLDATFDEYKKKIEIIKNNLFGIDIDPMGVEIARLRAWLSIVVGENINPKLDNLGIEPLPNLDFKFMCANSLIGPPESKDQEGLFEDPFFSELEQKVEEYFSATVNKDKKKEEIEKLINKKLKDKLQQINALSTSHYGQKYDDVIKKKNKKIVSVQIKVAEMWGSYRNIFSADAPVLFYETKYFFPAAKAGFDIVIGNPPYVSTKGRAEEYRQALEKEFGFIDDLYNHFYFKGIKLLKDNGILTYISSNTFWTIQTKKNLRELLQFKRLVELYDTGNPFEAPLVDTCVTIVRNHSEDEYKIRFRDGRQDLLKPIDYVADINIYKNAINRVFFKPKELNLKFYKKYNNVLVELMEKWWDKISTSENIQKNRKSLEEYRKTLRPGVVTLLGLITDGGQGLATANNGKYIGVLDGTKYADNVKEGRPKKLFEAVQQYKIKELAKIKTKNSAEDYLNKIKEEEIRQLFDDLKEKYGRDIFGQGYLYRVIRKPEIANIEKLTQDEKENGIKGDKAFVSYDKGDKEGNRWYLRTPYYIDWSKNSVKYLKDNSGKKGEGMPVVRNPQFYFKEGFCWILTLNQYSEYQKARFREKGVFDVNAMSLFSALDNFDSKYFICLLNSYLIYAIKYNFLNNTSAFQINDARQIPIIIPTDSQKKLFEGIFDEAYQIKEQLFDRKLSEEVAEKELSKIQDRLDKEVLELYGL